MPGRKTTAKRKSDTAVEDDKGSKKVKVSHRSHCKEAGQVLVLGLNDVGQLGLGEEIAQRKKPALLSLPEKIVQVIAGGMHTVCLSDTGHVYTFGCNDEGALGRDTTEEGSEMVPGQVTVEEKVVQVSAGDSHTAALTEDGTVYIWGAFRSSINCKQIWHSCRKNIIDHYREHLNNVPLFNVRSREDSFPVKTAIPIILP